MNVRELITQLLQEDMDAKVCVQINGDKWDTSVDVDGILTPVGTPDNVFIVPDLKLSISP